MALNDRVTLKQGLASIDHLLDIWKDLKPDAQTKLKMIIDNKIKLLRTTEMPNPDLEWNPPPYPPHPYPLLQGLNKLANKASKMGYESDEADDAIMEELESMIVSDGLGTPATTEVPFCFHGGVVRTANASSR